MDRRTFARTLSAIGVGLVGCRDAGGPVAPARPTSPEPPRPPVPPASYATDADRAFGVVAGLLRRAETVPNGVRWALPGEGGASSYATDLYEGQAGVLTFLAEAHRTRPDAALRAALEQGGRWLQAQPLLRRPALYTDGGDGGRVWAFLRLHEELGAGPSSTWLDSALAIAPGIASAIERGVGDLVASLPGQGLLMLRLHRATADVRWLAEARRMGDQLLAVGVPTAGDGIKFRSFVLPDGRPVFYPGFAHGAAGSGYFLCRLAAALPAAERGPYVRGAEATARGLDAIAQPRGAGVTWYRREPDQLEQQQVQWCHGAPGIGLFYAELHRLTGAAGPLETALRCAAHMDAVPEHPSACLCHGVAGNAQLYLALQRVTNDPAWLAKARRYGELAWTRRLRDVEHPAWRSGDSAGVDTPALMTGSSGVGWLYLQLARDGALGMPGLD